MSYLYIGFRTQHSVVPQIILMLVTVQVYVSIDKPTGALLSQLAKEACKDHQIPERTRGVCSRALLGPDEGVDGWSTWRCLCKLGTSKLHTAHAGPGASQVQHSIDRAHSGCWCAQCTSVALIDAWLLKPQILFFRSCSHCVLVVFARAQRGVSGIRCASRRLRITFLHSE